MLKIKLLRGEWEYNPNSRLGPVGGFASVFAGTGENQEPVSVKRLNLNARDAAYRELRIADELSQHNLKYVIPILDSGQDANSDHYFVIMPKAEKSLQQELKNKGSFTEKEAIDILLNIANGLTEVKDIVHRDLKPGNILYHENCWKIADFGIARFVGESTSTGTLKDYFSQPYAAPEQWRLEHATSATDIYALGCIAYALLTGKPPFQGPEREDYKKQHLQVEPIPLKVEANPRLRQLVSTMLRKPPASRPSIDRVIQILSDTLASWSDQSGSAGFMNLAIAGAKDAEAAIRSDTLKAQAEQRRIARKELSDTAFQILRHIADELASRIKDAALTVQILHNQAYFIKIQFGSATLGVELLNKAEPISENAFEKSGWDVIAGVKVTVIQREPKPYVWGANIWYSDLGQKKEYRWWEVSYMTNPFARKGRMPEPFALDMNQIADADIAASSIMGVVTNGASS